MTDHFVIGDQGQYLVMDYIEGTDVRVFQNDHAKRDLLVPVPLGAFIVSRVARALAYAHERGGSEALMGNTRDELCEGTGSNVVADRERVEQMPAGRLWRLAFRESAMRFPACTQASADTTC